MTRKSFVLHVDSLDVLDELTNEQAGMLFKAMRSFHINDGTELDTLTKIVFSPFKNQFNRDSLKYKTTCERRAAAGSMGGKQKVANARKPKQKVANVAESNNVSKNDSDSDSVNDNKSDSKSVSVRKEVGVKAKRFMPPTLTQVLEYCNERLNHVDANKFIDHYTSNGWLVGKNKMKDWKAAVRTWEKSSFDKPRVNQVQVSTTEFFK